MSVPLLVTEQWICAAAGGAAGAGRHGGTLGAGRHATPHQTVPAAVRGARQGGRGLLAPGGGSSCVDTFRAYADANDE